MGRARIEQAVESLNDADDLDAELIGARDRSVDGRVERGGVAARGKNSNSFHGGLTEGSAARPGRALGTAGS
jgi:hypothetical protein